MLSPRKSRTTPIKSRSISCIITLLEFTRRCVARQRWKRGYRTTFGVWKKLRSYYLNRRSDHAAHTRRKIQTETLPKGRRWYSLMLRRPYAALWRGKLADKIKLYHYRSVEPGCVKVPE